MDFLGAFYNDPGDNAAASHPKSRSSKTRFRNNFLRKRSQSTNDLCTWQNDGLEPAQKSQMREGSLLPSIPARTSSERISARPLPVLAPVSLLHQADRLPPRLIDDRPRPNQEVFSTKQSQHQTHTGTHLQRMKKTSSNPFARQMSHRSLSHTSSNKSLECSPARGKDQTHTGKPAQDMTRSGSNPFARTMSHRSLSHTSSNTSRECSSVRGKTELFERVEDEVWSPVLSPTAIATPTMMRTPPESKTTSRQAVFPKPRYIRGNRVP